MMDPGYDSYLAPCHLELHGSELFATAVSPPPSLKPFGTCTSHQFRQEIATRLWATLFMPTCAALSRHGLVAYNNCEPKHLRTVVLLDGVAGAGVVWFLIYECRITFVCLIICFVCFVCLCGFCLLVRLFVLFVLCLV